MAAKFRETSCIDLIMPSISRTYASQPASVRDASVMATMTVCWLRWGIEGSNDPPAGGMRERWSVIDGRISVGILFGWDMASGAGGGVGKKETGMRNPVQKKKLVDDKKRGGR